MGRFVGIHTLSGFGPGMLSVTTERLEGRLGDARFVRAYSSFADAKVVCDREAPGRDSVARVYAAVGFPSDEIVAVEAICENGEAGVGTRFV
jgi:hypothetical protein